MAVNDFQRAVNQFLVGRGARGRWCGRQAGSLSVWRSIAAQSRGLQSAPPFERVFVSAIGGRGDGRDEHEGAALVRLIGN
jgi:hypothetical protein